MGKDFGRKGITGVIMIDVETYRLLIMAVLAVGIFVPRYAFMLLLVLFLSHHWPTF